MEINGGTDTVKAKYYHGITPIGMRTSGGQLYYTTSYNGTVEKVTNLGGGVVADYTYDAFGNQTDSTADEIYNPFRYCGEYYDEETGLIYLRNRYYDPSIGAFINEDPIRDGLNWYSYCSGNPVAFVDPLGLSMTLGLDDAESNLKYLRMLTNDKLETTEIYNDNGELEGYNVVITERIDGDLVVGTSMIRRLIDDTEHNVTIQRGYGACKTEPKNFEAASTPGVGSGSTIYFNPLFKGKVLTEYKKFGGDIGVKEMDIPAEIELGHELIHALRNMGGNRIAYNDKTFEGYGTQAYRTGNGIEKVIDYKPMEELATTGVRYIRSDGSVANADQWVTTENALRAEHGYGRRVAY